MPWSISKPPSTATSPRTIRAPNRSSGPPILTPSCRRRPGVLSVGFHPLGAGRTATPRFLARGISPALKNSMRTNGRTSRCPLIPHGNIHRIAHDVLDLVVLGRVDAGHAGGQQFLRVLRRVCPRRRGCRRRRGRACGAGPPSPAACATRRGSRGRRCGRPPPVRRWRCGRGEADALVDHLDAGIAGGDGDLLGAVAVAVKAGLADQHLQAAAGTGVGGFCANNDS